MAISYRYGNDGQTTIRGCDGKKNTLVYTLRRFYSLYQFFALGSHLIESPKHAGDLGYNTIVAIQSSAFLMTLNRNHKAPPHPALAPYSSRLGTVLHAAPASCGRVLSTG